MPEYWLKDLHSAASKGKAQEKSTDPAWVNAGSKEGLEIWRIEKFTVQSWPKEQYGKFYTGDSYIVLKTISKGGDSKSYDVHFWLGDKTSQDEAGTAAYKTVELDDHLGGAPVQYREVEGYESERFLELFPKGITILNGGIETGFNKVKPEDYKPRLLHIHGSLKSCSAQEVPLSKSSLNSDDVFILDNGLELIQWNGKNSNAGEKTKGGAILRAIQEERNFKTSDPIILDEGDSNPNFWKLLGGQGEITGKSTGRGLPREKALFKLSDATGNLKFTEIARGNIKRDQLKSEDVFIIDTGKEIFAWVGSKASATEKRNALIYAEDYIEKYKLPRHTPIVREVQGHENDDFNQAF